jgi:hypothetical protein
MTKQSKAHKALQGNLASCHIMYMKKQAACSGLRSITAEYADVLLPAVLMQCQNARKQCGVLNYAGTGCLMLAYDAGTA